MGTGHAPCSLTPCFSACGPGAEAGPTQQNNSYLKGLKKKL